MPLADLLHVVATLLVKLLLQLDDNSFVHVVKVTELLLAAGLDLLQESLVQLDVELRE